MHDHGHAHDSGHFRYCGNRHLCWCEPLRYLYALLISIGIAAVEIIGWRLSGSVALLGDVGHVIADGIGFGFALALSIYIRRKVSRTRRSIRIAGFAVQILLLTVALGWIGFETIHRLIDPPAIAPVPLMIAALIGGAGNIAQLAVLRELKNLTAYGAWMHALLDLGSSVMVVCGGVALWITGSALADPIAALVILVLLVLHTGYMLRRATRGDAHRQGHHAH